MTEDDVNVKYMEIKKKRNMQIKCYCHYTSIIPLPKFVIMCHVQVHEIK